MEFRGKQDSEAAFEWTIIFLIPKHLDKGKFWKYIKAIHVRKAVCKKQVIKFHNNQFNIWKIFLIQVKRAHGISLVPLLLKLLIMVIFIYQRVVLIPWKLELMLVGIHLKRTAYV